MARGTGTNRTDIAVSLTKGILGMLPVVGGLIAEAVGTFIPNQRLDRIERFLILLDERLTGFDREFLERKFAEPEFADLLEEGMLQAARSLSDERKRCIASLLKNSLSDTELQYVQQKRLLGILAELSDVDVLRLYDESLFRRPSARHDLRARHTDVLTPPGFMDPRTPGEVQEKLCYTAFYDASTNLLVRLGLLEPIFAKRSKDEPPEFDAQTGTLKSYGLEVTWLGDRLLRYLDLGA